MPDFTDRMADGLRVNDVGDADPKDLIKGITALPSLGMPVTVHSDDSDSESTTDAQVLLAVRDESENLDDEGYVSESLDEVN